MRILLLFSWRTSDMCAFFSHRSMDVLRLCKPLDRFSCYISPRAHRSVQVARENPSAGINLTLSAQERLDVNLSTTFIELVLAMMKAWGPVSVQNLEASRGSYAPYRIKNLTGTAIHIWADSDSAAGESSAVRISDGQTVDWRFEDWKTMREVCLLINPMSPHR